MAFVAANHDRASQRWKFVPRDSAGKLGCGDCFPKRVPIVGSTQTGIRFSDGDSRVLLAPSLWNEPAGRVVAEALPNAIPPLVSVQLARARQDEKERRARKDG
jgi:hypothetical protein